MRVKDINLNDYVNSKVNITGIILANTISITKRDEPMLNIVLGDNRSTITLKCFWSDYKEHVKEQTDIPEELQPGKLVTLFCEVNLYNGNPSAIIKSFEENFDDISQYKSLFPKYDNFLKLYDKLINELSDSDLKALMQYETEKYFDIFSKVPAGKTVHHTEIGSCLCHSVTIALNSIGLCKNYNFIYGDNFINQDVVVVSALLHDFMKVKEYIFDEDSGACDIDDIASVSSHIMMMLDELLIAKIQLNLLNSKSIEHVRHCIAAHHGKLEYGSPVTPACPEAYMLGQLDVLDSKMWQMDSLKSSMQVDSKSNNKFIMGERVSYYDFNKED